MEKKTENNDIDATSEYKLNGEDRENIERNSDTMAKVASLLPVL